MASQWFAVKTLYRSVTDDRPERPDLDYDPDSTMVEERVLLIKAKDKAEALQKAEREARDYAGRTGCVNPYNQKVRTYCLPAFDVYELSEAPGDRTEVFQVTRLMSRRISDEKVAHVLMGAKESQIAMAKKRKFINQDYDPHKGANREKR